MFLISLLEFQHDPDKFVYMIMYKFVYVIIHTHTTLIV